MELDYLSDNQIFYYCDRFQNSCEDDPTADYVIGNHVLPVTCHEECVHDPSVAKEAVKNHSLSTETVYKGLGSVVSDDFMGPTLSGNSARFRDVLVDPRIKFIRLKNTNIYAKVLVYVIHTGAFKKPPTLDQRAIYVAYELAGVPSGFTEIEFTKLDADPCFAQHVKFAPAGKVPVDILVLTKTDPASP